MLQNKNTFLGYLALLSLFGMTGFVFGALNGTATEIESIPQEASVINALSPIQSSDISVTAKAAYVFDISENTVLFEKNPQTQLPLASITKIPLILLAHEYLDPEDRITFTQQSLQPEGDSGFQVGESWRVQDLIDFTLMTSSNDGATAIAQTIEQRTGLEITQLLNDLAADLNLTQTYFINETGLDNSTGLSGAYGSAQDISTLFLYAYQTIPDILAATARPEYTFTNLSGDVYEATNTNKVIGELPGLVFGKTGYTDLAGGNLGVVVETEPGHPLVIVVLGSTIDERFSDVSYLTHAALPSLEK